MKISEVQWQVIDMLSRSSSPLLRPRGTLERLEKKGVVQGNRRDGWSLTDKGRAVCATRKS